MELKKTVTDFIVNPFPLWNNELAKQLVFNKSKSFTEPYSIVSCILNEIAEEKTLPLNSSPIKLALPSTHLQFFYEEHGLNPFVIHEYFDSATHKVEQALNTFKQIPKLKSFIETIIFSIQILEAEHAETDVSYSHPDVPFSIFVSICSDNVLKSTLRTAESILHEAMHLKLTLVEDCLPLVKPFNGNVYFSPWRDEKRPARGVLHGLFVFRSLLEFFNLIINIAEFESERAYIQNRIVQITNEINCLYDFTSCSDLTKDGAILTTSLLPLS